MVAHGIGPSNDPDGEFLRENLRAESYGDKPSRLRSSFVFETYADAERFRDSYRQGAAIYKVQFADPKAQRHRVTWSAFQPGHCIPVERQAQDFWRGGMLYSSDIEVFAETDLIFL